MGRDHAADHRADRPCGAVRGSRPRRRHHHRRDRAGRAPSRRRSRRVSPGLAGLDAALLAFELPDPALHIERLCADGARVERGHPLPASPARRGRFSRPSGPRSTSCAGCRGSRPRPARLADAIAGQRPRSSARARRRRVCARWKKRRCGLAAAPTIALASMMRC